MSRYIKKLIESGEGQKLDFKYEISDSKKIARTFVAFANSEGGKLLIGVKDNGVISGIRSDEEFHMVRAAADLYCRPKIKFSEKTWHIDKKTIMEVSIPKSTKSPHYAPDKNGKWLAWVRIDDQTLQANDILVEVWKQKKSKKGIFIKYTEKEKALLEYLSRNESITISKFCRLSNLSRRNAKKILIDLISVGVIDIVIKEKAVLYRLISQTNGIVSS